MQLVERHLIKKTHKFWQECDALCFKAKNLYNLCNYYMRQSFFETGRANTNTKLYHRVVGSDAYKQMPSTKIACSLIRQVCQVWTGYFRAHRDWKANPEKYQNSPKIPNYKDKLKGRYLVLYKGDEAIYKKPLAYGICHLSQSDIKIPMYKAKKPVQARIVPKNGSYVIEVVYEVEDKIAKVGGRIAGIDLGVNNLVTLTCNDSRVRPLLINGKPLKSINRLYNKTRSQIQSKIGSPPLTPLKNAIGDRGINLLLARKTSNRLNGITLKRNNQVANYLHLTSSIPRLRGDRLRNYLKANGLSILVVGKNEGWKQAVNIGKRNNQNFVQIPHARLIEMLDYKCQLSGIKLSLSMKLIPVSVQRVYLEPIQKHGKYLGRRVHRGLFRTASNQVINADINGRSEYH